MSYRFIDIEQGSDEWLKMRENYIGGSDAPVIMGDSTRKTPHQLWREKLGFYENKDSYILKKGRSLEKQSRDWFNANTGYKMVPKVAVKEDVDFLMSSLDGICEITGKAIEIKYVGEKDFELALSCQVPVEYMPQLQHQMFVLDADNIFYLSCDGTRFHFFSVDRNEKYIKNMLEQERIFWDKVQNFIEPALTDRDYIVKENEEWKEKAQELIETKKELKKLEEKEKSLKESLITLSGGMNSFGSGVRVRKVIRQGNIEYKTIPEIKMINLEQYRKPPTEYWKVS